MSNAKTAVLAAQVRKLMTACGFEIRAELNVPRIEVREDIECDGYYSAARNLVTIREPDSAHGRSVLAHELCHAQQPRQALTGTLRSVQQLGLTSEREVPAEREAYFIDAIHWETRGEMSAEWLPSVAALVAARGIERTRLYRAGVLSALVHAMERGTMIGRVPGLGSRGRLELNSFMRQPRG